MHQIKKIVYEKEQTQSIFTNNPFPETITVSGSAEMEIIPDEIFVNIELKEYQKKGESKKDIKTIKSEFLQACKNDGITYQVKFKNSDLMDHLVERLNDAGHTKF